MTFARVVATANKQAEAKQQLQVSAPLFTCLAVNAQSTGSPARDGRPWRCTQDKQSLAVRLFNHVMVRKLFVVSNDGTTLIS